MASSDYKHKWAGYRREWMTGKYRTLKEMARKKRIPISTLWKRAAKEKWVVKKGEVDERIEEKAEQKIVEQGASRIVNQRLDMLEKQLKYTQILIGMGFGTLKGKTKLSRESDGLRAIFGAMDQQLRIIQEYRRETEQGPPSDVVIPGMQVNLTVNQLTAQARDMTSEQLENRLAQIEEEKRRLYGGDDGGDKK